MKILLVLSSLLFLIRYTKGNYYPLALAVSHNYYQLVAYEDLKAKANKCVDLDVSILCCSAETTQEEIFNEEIGSTFNHFVRKIIRQKSDFDEEIVCENKYEPSVQESPKPKTDYMANPTDDLVVYRSGYNVCVYDDRLEIAGLPKFQEDKNCDFFNTLEIIFEKSAATVKQVRYEITAVEDESNFVWDVCDNYDIGSDLIGFDAEEAYEWENQNKLLDDMGWQKTVTGIMPLGLLPNNSGTFRTLVLCEYEAEKIVLRKQLLPHEREYLHPQSLAPTRHFRNQILQLPVCSFLNVSPMWLTAAFAMERLQTFVRKLANLIGKIKIVTGPYGVFEYGAVTETTGTNGEPVTSCERKNLEYLLGDKIRVSALFYTLIVHRIHASDSIIIDYGIIVITSNGEWTRPPSSYCQVIDCVEAGFENVNELGLAVQSACCAFTAVNLNALKIDYLERTTKRPLNLKKFFPHLDALNLGETIDISDKITFEQSSIF